MNAEQYFQICSTVDVRQLLFSLVILYKISKDN